ncbi:MAG: family protein phosphatase [Acidobacteriota bacterium]|jgi:serine/threonine protein phosphatase PrpC|nr:family protein phosphatase [Acidobacteriota bacterium]
MIRTDLEARNSLCCVASVTLKTGEERNEDAATVLVGGDSTVHGVAVADGLGSYTHAREASQFVVERAAMLMKTSEISSGDHLYEVFTRIRQDLRDHVRQFPSAEPPEAATFGTTLIVAVETPNQLIAAYAGNGAIWHLRGNFDESTAATGISWSAVNYLRPHSLFVGGREQLYNFIAPVEELDGFPPTVITVDKDRKFGDILFICTDGIYSADQILYGTDAKGDLWISAEPSMASFYECLRAYFSQACEGPGLKDCMQRYLLDLKGRQLLEDDATVGVIVTGAALAHQQRKRRPAKSE